MRIISFFTLFFALNASAQQLHQKSWELPHQVLGDRSGSGGWVLWCEDPESNEISIELLDFRNADRLGMNLSFDIHKGSDHFEKFESVMKNLETVDPVRATNLRTRVQMFNPESESFRTHFNQKAEDFVELELDQFQSTEDTGIVWVPSENCKLVLAVYQQNEEFLSRREAKFLVNGVVWNHEAMTDDVRAGLMLHELLYEEALLLGHKTSRFVQKLTAIVYSNVLAGESPDPVAYYFDLYDTRFVGPHAEEKNSKIVRLYIDHSYFSYNGKKVSGYTGVFYGSEASRLGTHYSEETGEVQHMVFLEPGSFNVGKHRIDYGSGVGVLWNEGKIASVLGGKDISLLIHMALKAQHIPAQGGIEPFLARSLSFENEQIRSAEIKTSHLPVVSVPNSSYRKIKFDAQENISEVETGFRYNFSEPIQSGRTYVTGVLYGSQGEVILEFDHSLSNYEIQFEGVSLEPHSYTMNSTGKVLNFVAKVLRSPEMKEINGYELWNHRVYRFDFVESGELTGIKPHRE